ncbi:hypothetical protein NUU61_005775 [Penicillium alfredii]|uniref:Uncharacterized protein n=1 Tax=Penicillium alfredii TaxID=1506179 RepID=A0A9W9K7W4_9EURO|nr:uncharacterized protein NUU61_005775 [Penicillium alfredii]KAJ5096419.1 hypothetical protein NUU61_005775 [Penicillium alfredii]
MHFQSPLLTGLFAGLALGSTITVGTNSDGKCVLRADGAPDCTGDSGPVGGAPEDNDCSKVLALKKDGGAQVTYENGDGKLYCTLADLKVGTSCTLGTTAPEEPSGQDGGPVRARQLRA